MIARRRIVLALAAGALLGVGAAQAQPAKRVYRVGVLSIATPEFRFSVPRLLRERGYEEGRNIAFEYQFASFRDELLPGLAAALVAKKVDLIVAAGTDETVAAKRATSSIPIVMMSAQAPVELGLVASLARPGGNLTGTTSQGPITAAKNLQLLREVVPHATRVIVLTDRGQVSEMFDRERARAAESMGIRLTQLPVSNTAELDAALARIVRERPDALHVSLSKTVILSLARVIEFAARQKLPAIYSHKSAVIDGGLISNNSIQDSMDRRCAAIIDRILKGANPAEIAIEEPTDYELTINMKTARALGIKIPESLLLRASQVIE